MANDRTVAGVVLDRHGATYAHQAGIRLSDKPAPLYQLLVLSTLLSARISTDVAIAAARELFAAGYRTPKRMYEATWQQRIDALGRGHYRRYDERTSTMLGNGARLLLDNYRGDLRRMHAEAGGDLAELRVLLKEVPGIGDIGADIFLREAQAVWPDVRPFVDARACRGAAEIGLPADPNRLARLVPRDRISNFVAGLVRLSLDRNASRALVRQTH